MDFSSPPPEQIGAVQAAASAQLAVRDSRLDRFALAGELVMSVAHDLRQPIAAIQMNVAAALHLLRRPMPAVDAAIGALEGALQEERRIRDAVQILLELATNRAPSREACDIAVALRQALALVRTEAAAHRVAIEVGAPPTLPLVFGDLVLIRQAFVSLLLEAIELTAFASLDDGVIHISVRQVDHAVEVDAVHPGRIADDAIDWQFAIVRSVVEEHEGQIAVTAADGKTRVTTQWPLHAR